MPTMDISREQEAYIEALREELADQVTYGHVRTKDALQYLIDHHREDGEVDVEVDADIEPDGGAVDPGSAPSPGDTGGVSADGESNAGGGDAGGGSNGDGVDGDGGESRDGSDGSGGDGGDDGEGGGDGGGPTRTTSSGPDLADAAAALSRSGPGDAGGAGGDGGGETVVDIPDTVGDSGDERVNEMMNLLSTHEEKWTESDGAEGKYEVELPDGGTERVQTRDDVRALLFKHYR